jgi:hypothetical protein
VPHPSRTDPSRTFPIPVVTNARSHKADSLALRSAISLKRMNSRRDEAHDASSRLAAIEPADATNCSMRRLTPGSDRIERTNRIALHTNRNARSSISFATAAICCRYYARLRPSAMLKRFRKHAIRDKKCTTRREWRTQFLHYDGRAVLFRFILLPSPFCLRPFDF